MQLTVSATLKQASRYLERYIDPYFVSRRHFVALNIATHGYV